MTAIEGLLEAVFSVGSAPKQYREDPRLVEEFSSGWQFSLAFERRLRRDGTIVEL
jgi:hypothetical protein